MLVTVPAIYPNINEPKIPVARHTSVFVPIAARTRTQINGIIM